MAIVLWFVPLWYDEQPSPLSPYFIGLYLTLAALVVSFVTSKALPQPRISSQQRSGQKKAVAGD
jgi:hypothetical protein